VTTPRELTSGPRPKVGTRPRVDANLDSRDDIAVRACSTVVIRIVRESLPRDTLKSSNRSSRRSGVTPVEQRRCVPYGVCWVNGRSEEPGCLAGRRKPSLSGTSWMSRESHQRICERLCVKTSGLDRMPETKPRTAPHMERFPPRTMTCPGSSAKGNRAIGQASTLPGASSTLHYSDLSGPDPSYRSSTVRRKSRVRGSRGALNICSGLASSTIRPWSMNTTRDATCRAKLISCVTTSIVIP
jgi:hypothetical protein